jgi:MYXO-CTERM domain-containing protein
LVETCGEDPPSLPDSCTGEVLTDCEAFVAKCDHFAMLCGDDVPEVNIARIGHCCDTYSDPLSAAYRACLLAIDSETCPAQQLGACESPGDPEGDTDNDGAVSGAGESKEDGEAASRGCSVGAGTGRWSAGLVLLAFAARVRRRR